MTMTVEALLYELGENPENLWIEALGIKAIIADDTKSDKKRIETG